MEVSFLGFKSDFVLFKRNKTEHIMNPGWLNIKR